MMKLIFSYFALVHIIFSCTAERIIIDTDAGADDGLAILMLLRAQQAEPDKIQIVGITCTYGNTAEENVERNVLKILTVANRSDIPVYRGSKNPLIGTHRSDDFFGRDGFGDAPFTRNLITELDESMHASLALIELTKKYEGDIRIAVLGPTTNVALAASLDENFISRVNKFYVMGSSVAGQGNYKANVEFNFAADPESNRIFLNKINNSSQLNLFPWEACLFAKLPWDWRVNVLGKINSPYVKFINAIESMGLKYTLAYNPPDVFLAATIVWPHVIKETLDTYVHALTDGPARGSVIVEYPRAYKPYERTNAKIIQSIHVGVLKQALVYYFSCDYIPCDY